MKKTANTNESEGCGFLVVKLGAFIGMLFMALIRVGDNVAMGCARGADNLVGASSRSFNFGDDALRLGDAARLSNDVMQLAKSSNSSSLPNDRNTPPVLGYFEVENEFLPVVEMGLLMNDTSKVYIARKSFIKKTANKYRQIHIFEEYVLIKLAIDRTEEEWEQFKTQLPPFMLALNNLKEAFGSIQAHPIVDAFKRSFYETGDYATAVQTLIPQGFEEGMDGDLFALFQCSKLNPFQASVLTQIAERSIKMTPKYHSNYLLIELGVDSSWVKCIYAKRKNANSNLFEGVKRLSTLNVIVKGDSTNLNLAGNGVQYYLPYDQERGINLSFDYLGRKEPEIVN